MNYSKKKVMFVSDSLADGGAQKVMAILASTSAELGADVSLVLIREKKKFYEISDKVKLFELKTQNSKIPFGERIKQLREIIKKEEVTTLIPFMPLISLYVFIANIGIGKKIIVSERADPRISVFKKGISWKDRIGIFIRKLGLYRLADWVVFQTADAQSYYSRKVQKKSSIIANPLDLQKLPERYEGEREKTVVAVGRLSEEKNFSMLLKGFSEFCKKHPEYRLIIYGEGPLRTCLEEEIKILRIENFVEMPGFVQNVSEKIHKAGMYISTSNHEGISNSMIEALGMGIPTIVTDCPVGGSQMFVNTDVNGVLIPMNDKKALVEAMTKIADDKIYEGRISKEAATVREKLAAENICKEWLELVD